MHTPPESPTVAIIALTLVPGVIGGAETYVRELALALSAQRGTVEPHMILPPLAPDAHGGLDHTVVSSYCSGITTSARMLAMGRAFAWGRTPRRELRVERFDALHYPLTAHVPRVSKLPCATSILDVQHLEHPEFFSAQERAYRRVVFGHAVRRSDIIITISNYAARTLSAQLSIPADRIRTIHLGVDAHRFAATTPQKRENFLLYPANPWPHKNHVRLFEAFRAVRRDEPELELVLTGTGLESLPTEPGVTIAGRVSSRELAHLYQTARAVVFPSLYEGFGMPPLEAMAASCPVATSTAAALPEVCGDAALYVKPSNAEAIADGIRRVLNEDNAKRIAAGHHRVEQLTWDICARKHLDVYEQLLA